MLFIYSRIPSEKIFFCAILCLKAGLSENFQFKISVYPDIILCNLLFS